jgi:Fe-S cluster assembly protein SufD
MTIHQSSIRPAPTAAERGFLELHTSVSARLPGARNKDVRAWRRGAIEQLEASGLPHRRIEAWKYTDLRSLLAEVLPLGGLEPSARTVTAKTVESAIGEGLASLDAYRGVFVAGSYRPDLSTLDNARGVTFAPLSQVLEDPSGSLELLTKLPRRDGDIIAALAQAFATDGAVLAIAPGTRLAKPLHLIFLGPEGKAQLHAVQNFLSAGVGSEITLIETHAGPGQAIVQTSVQIEGKAAVKHIRTNLGPGSIHLSSLSVTLGAGANYEPVQVTADGALTRAEAHIRFEGERARCHYAGAMMLKDRSHCDFTLVVDHAAPACESRELVKAVLNGRARGVFQGKVIVQRGAQQTDGKQMANALLLSDDAEFDSKPELEIFADDVVCGHGATAGQLDEDMVFYLRARGLPEVEARALLVAAFIGEALEKIENEALREALQDNAEAWLRETS